jgi:hypothetical protein
MTHEELKKLLVECKNEGAFSMVPERNDNGADAYRCPACYATTRIMGHAYAGAGHYEVEHEEGCCLVRLIHEIESFEFDDESVSA